MWDSDWIFRKVLGVIPLVWRLNVVLRSIDPSMGYCKA